MHENNGSLPVERYGFIITKPLQLMIVLTIIEQLPQETIKDLIIVDAFENSDRVANNLKGLGKRWGVTHFKRNQAAAYRHALSAGYTKLFIDADVGLQKYLQLIVHKIKSPGTLIAVYEEGVGSYRDYPHPKWKKSILRLIGAGTYFGGCHLTKEIYLYHPDEYYKNLQNKRVAVIQISMTVAKFIESFWDVLLKIFDADKHTLPIDVSNNDASCVIYLSNWSFEGKDLEKLSTSAGLNLLKLHPHIKNVKLGNTFGFISVLSSIPAEIMIIHASRHFKSVKVYHHDSSVTRYSALENVEFCNLRTTI